MRYLIGIDEAGRGPWAGPIVAWGFMCPIDFDFSIFGEYLTDSKKMTESGRDDVFWKIEKVMEGNICRYHFAYRDALSIDRYWIRESNKQSMEEVILSFLQYIWEDDTVDILIDGCDNYDFGLDGFDYIFAKKKTRSRHSLLPASGNPDTQTIYTDSRLQYSEMTEKKLITQNTITYLINWDSLSPVISAASVVAKVIRDQMMCDFHEDFPQYWFRQHKGYGTTKHREAMMNYGITPIHRKSYAPVKSLILNSSSV